MTLRLDEIAEVSRTVALEHGRALEIVGVTSTDGGIDRVEILVTIAGCHTGPCRFTVNVTRAGRGAFEQELRTKLSDALGRHLAAG